MKLFYFFLHTTIALYGNYLYFIHNIFVLGKFLHF